MYPMSTFDTDIVDFIDLINFTLSEEFIEKWRYRFSVTFIKEFQSKVIKSLKDRKPIKLECLGNHMSKKCGYSHEQIRNFFEAIDIKLYHPLILGKLSASFF